ncbi:glycosyltransferase family 4 protein [Hyphomicrobium facile]|uniref:Glycosyltransferase involved in cell wall bisynthesis n=1 Tax=Hyphomicrobium facile TaxID=51670 RepID=A0A1I7N5J9_9HYPH|nr:glycosyltransferase family 4 protein [Hyphomicrobium facile]SFV29944.1 Glycosyltransferase involved in cell wall bisynthesis [Hyphomicrobium facile]
MRILMVAARYFPFAGGTEMHVHEVATRLVRRGHDVSVVTANPGGVLPEHEIVAGIDIIRVRSWPKSRDWQFAPGLARVIGQSGCDVMHVQGYHTFFAPFAMWAAKRHAIPFVLSFHSGGHSSPLRNRLRHIQARMIAPLVRPARRYIAVSEFEVEHFAEAMSLPSDKFLVVPNGANLNASLPRPDVPEDENLILSIGRLERYKGHHRAIDAMPLLLRLRPKARLQIVGTGPYERTLRQRIHQLRLDEHVTIGSIPASDRGAMATLLAQARLAVLFSDYEAHPVAVIEALSLNKTVVVTATSGLRELADRSLAYAVPLDAGAETIAAAMSNAMDIKPTPRSLALSTWDECTATLESVYKVLLAERSEASRFPTPCEAR